MTTPLSAAMVRRPVTVSSRATMRNTTHPGTRSKSTKPMRAAVTSSLSARGSMNLPKSVTSPRLRAMFPSRASVMEARAKTTRAASQWWGQLWK